MRNQKLSLEMQFGKAMGTTDGVEQSNDILRAEFGMGPCDNGE